MSRAQDELFADLAAVKILDALTLHGTVPPGAAPVQVNDRQAAEDLLRTAVLEVLDIARRRDRHWRKRK